MRHQSPAKAIRERTSPNVFSHHTWMLYDRHTLLSRVTLQSIIAASAVEQSSFFHIAILSQMQLIVQPYYLHNYFKCMFRVL